MNALTHKPEVAIVYSSWADSRLLAKGFFSQAQIAIVVTMRTTRVRERLLPLNLKVFPPFISAHRQQELRIPTQIVMLIQLFLRAICSAKAHHILRSNHYVVQASSACG
jgi:hypothetical protein